MRNEKNKILSWKNSIFFAQLFALIFLFAPNVFASSGTVSGIIVATPTVAGSFVSNFTCDDPGDWVVMYAPNGFYNPDSSQSGDTCADLMTGNTVVSIPKGNDSTGSVHSAMGIWNFYEFSGNTPTSCTGDASRSLCPSSVGYVSQFSINIQVSTPGNSIASIFPVFTGSIGDILYNGLYILATLMACLTALGILVLYVLKWIGGKGLMDAGMSKRIGKKK